MDGYGWYTKGGGSNSEMWSSSVFHFPLAKKAFVQTIPTTFLLFSKILLIG